MSIIEFNCLSEGISTVSSAVLGLHVAAITPTRYLQVQPENRLSVPAGRPRMLLPPWQSQGQT